MNKYKFGDIVTVDGQMGVIVQTWGTDNYEVYVKNRGVRTRKTKDISDHQEGAWRYRSGTNGQA